MLARSLTLLVALFLIAACGSDTTETGPGQTDPGPATDDGAPLDEATVEMDEGTGGTVEDPGYNDPGTDPETDEGTDPRDPGLEQDDDGPGVEQDEGVTPTDDEGVTPVDDEGVTPVDDEGVTPVDDEGVTSIDDEGVTPPDDDGGTPPDDDPGIDPCACLCDCPVCGIDEIEYACEQAALCAGLTHEEFQKGSCQQGICRGDDACIAEEEEPYVTCGYGNVEYQTKCEVREAFGCKPWNELMFADDVIECPGDCLTCHCTCDRTWDPVCGSDGETYDNICILRQCSPGSPTLECGGACVDYDALGCPDCAGQCDPVCGRDGNTYQSECAAECAGTTVKHVYACDKICYDEELVQPVCGTNGVTYQNYCELYAAFAVEAYEGACDCTGCGDLPVVPVCGSDGVTYDNACEATACGGVTEYEPGVCACNCPNAYDPVCGEDGVTYPSQCVANCLGADNATAGICSACLAEVRCADYSLRACLDGMTFPSPAHATHLACTGQQDATVDTKEPCADCEEDTDCNDLDPCTTDTCSEAGECTFEAIAGCADTPEWTRPGDCPDL